MVSLGNTGVFATASPYTISNTVMTCTGRDTLSTLVRHGIDVYKKAYEPAGITEQEFNMVGDPVIVILKEASGKLHYYPESVLSLHDSTEVVPYVKKAMVVGLGFHQDSKTFHQVESRIKELLVSIEGIEPTLDVTDVSLAKHIPNHEHNTIINRRRALKNSPDNISNLLNARDDQILLLRTQLAAMVSFVTDYLEGCCNNNVCWSFGQTVANVVPYELSLDDMLLIKEQGNPFAGIADAYSYGLRSSKQCKIG